MCRSFINIIIILKLGLATLVLRFHSEGSKTILPTKLNTLRSYLFASIQAFLGFLLHLGLSITPKQSVFITVACIDFFFINDQIILHKFLSFCLLLVFPFIYPI